MTSSRPSLLRELSGAILAPLAGLAADHPLAAAFPHASALYVRPHNAGDVLIAGKRYIDSAGRVRQCRDDGAGPYVIGHGSPGSVADIDIVARIVGTICPEDAPPARRSGLVVAFHQPPSCSTQ